MNSQCLLWAHFRKRKHICDVFAANGNYFTVKERWCDFSQLIQIVNFRICVRSCSFHYFLPHGITLWPLCSLIWCVCVSIFKWREWRGAGPASGKCLRLLNLWEMGSWRTSWPCGHQLLTDQTGSAGWPISRHSSKSERLLHALCT